MEHRKSVLAVGESLCDVVAGRGRRANAILGLIVYMGAGNFKKSLALSEHQLVSLLTLT